MTRLVLIGLVVGAGPMLALNGVLLLGSGPWATPGAEALLLPAIVAAAALVAAGPLLAFRRTRRGGARIFLASIGLLVGTVIGLVGGDHLRMVAFDLAAQRAEPLVQAIGRFERDHGRPPATLHELVPRYLAQLPAGVPDLELVTGEAGRLYQGNTWALRASVPAGLLNFDEFLYLPTQNYDGYPAHRRVRGWAYVQ